jgi:hypothetical protein
MSAMPVLLIKVKTALTRRSSWLKEQPVAITHTPSRKPLYTGHVIWMAWRAPQKSAVVTDQPSTKQSASPGQAETL